MFNNYEFKIKNILKKEMHGPYQGRNYGLNLASGEYICFLDIDDYWHKKLNSEINILKVQKELENDYMPNIIQPIPKSKLNSFINDKQAIRLLYDYHQATKKQSFVEDLNPKEQDLLLEMGEKANS